MANDKQGIALKGIINGIVRSLQEAKYAGDIESARLRELYKKDKALSLFSVPSFTIADVDIELRFSVAEPSRDDKEPSDIKVHISPDALKGLEAHHVSTLKLKVSPVNLRIFEENK